MYHFCIFTTILLFSIQKSISIQCVLTRVDFDRVLFCCDILDSNLLCATIDENKNELNSAISRIISGNITCENFSNLYYCCNEKCQTFPYIEDKNTQNKTDMIRTQNSRFQGLNFCVDFNGKLVCISFKNQRNVQSDEYCNFESDSQFCCPVNNTNWCIVNTRVAFKDLNYNNTQTFKMIKPSNASKIEVAAKEVNIGRANDDDLRRLRINTDIEREPICECNHKYIDETEETITINSNIFEGIRLGWSWLRDTEKHLALLQITQRNAHIKIQVIGLQSGNYILKFGSTSSCDFNLNENISAWEIEVNKFRLGSLNIYNYMNDLRELKTKTVYLTDEKDSSNTFCGTFNIL